MNFKTLNFIFYPIFFGMMGLDLVFGFTLWNLWIPLVLFVAGIVYGASRINSNMFINVVCSGKNNGKEISITFDDGPDFLNTPKILEILNRNKVEAAFFCIGERIDESPDLARRISDEGHILGNHTYSHHTFFDLFSKAKMHQELFNTDNAIQKAINHRSKFFRPPYGVTNPNLAATIIRGGYYPIGWSIRSMDTVEKDESKLLSRVTKGLKAGDIVLFHDTEDITVNILDQFISKVKQQGFEFVRLDKLLEVNAYA